MEQERIIVYNGAIGTYEALRQYIKDYTSFRDATQEEIESWRKLNK